MMLNLDKIKLICVLYVYRGHTRIICIFIDMIFGFVYTDIISLIPMDQSMQLLNTTLKAT